MPKLEYLDTSLDTEHWRASRFVDRFLQLHEAPVLETKLNSTVKFNLFNVTMAENTITTNSMNFLIKLESRFVSQAHIPPNQMGNSERMIRTINNVIRALLFQARLSPCYWVEALNVVVHILKILPSTAIQNQIPHSLLFHKNPTCDHLRVFGCLCFPSLNHSKLSPRTTPCLFLWYPSQQKVYRCLDLKTNKIIISRYVYFDEDTFPATNQNLSQVSSYTFLNAVDDPSPLFKEILQSPLPQNQPPPPQTLSVPMNTRSKSGITKPKKVLSLVTTAKAPLPKSHNQALLDPNWNPAMTDEYDAMTKTKIRIWCHDLLRLILLDRCGFSGTNMMQMECFLDIKQGW